MTRIHIGPARFGAPWELQVFASQMNDRHPDYITLIHTPVLQQVKREDLCGAYGEDHKPLLIIDRQDPGLQELMNDLWNLGIRPKQVGEAGNLDATKFHLDDMRRIAFSRLGLEALVQTVE